MKKMSVVLLAMSLTVALFGIANAGLGGGCANCPQTGANTPSEQLRKFQADTIDLRQEMMTKRFDVQRENLKATPDTAKVAALKADIKAIQAKIQAIRTQSGLPADKCDGECAKKSSDCGTKSLGGCGKGSGGCNGPCGK